MQITRNGLLCFIIHKKALEAKSLTTNHRSTAIGRQVFGIISSLPPQKIVFCISTLPKPPAARYPHSNGSVAEWFKALVLKTSVRGTVPWVRIPPLPPLALAKVFSRSGCGQIFSLFSRVMRERLSTGPGARMGGSGLSGPIFSRADDYANLV
jgi:hypothetical protein